MKKSFKIILLIPSAIGLAAGAMMWLAAVASWIYRIFTFVVDSKMNVLNTINFLPPIILKWFLNNFGRSAYWFLDMDITIPIVGMGLVFIVIGILFNLAAKKI